MTEQNLIDQNDTDNIDFDPNVNYLEQLVGENKKFKDVNSLAEGKARSDNYIKVLEARLDAMREDYLKMRDENVAGPKLKEYIDQLDTRIQQLASREQNPPKSNEVHQPELDLNKLDSLVSAKVEQIHQTQRQAENFKEVEAKVQERFGDNFKTILRDQARSLGLSDEEVNSMARNNPKLFFKTFDVSQKAGETFQNPPRSMQRSDNFAPKGSQERTMSYYMELKKKDPLAWYNKDIAVQMDKDSQRLGESFYDV